MSLLAMSLLVVMEAAAQENRPQIVTGERKQTVIKDPGPRAVGILQLDANGKTSLVPIAIMINGKFWDASAYKADPVPMALESGTVYEVERTGSSEGLFTVGAALHSNAANVPIPWLATGNWVPAGSEKPKTKNKDTVPVGMETTEGPPRLVRSNPASPSAPSPAPSTPGTSGGNAPGASVPDSKAPSSTSSSTTSSSGGSSSGGSTSGGSANPPVKSGPPSDSPSPTTTSSGSTQSGGSAAPGSTPGSSTAGASTTPSGNGASTGTIGSVTPPESKPGDSKQSDDSKSSATKHSKMSEATPISDSGTDAADRPRLRRGRPTGPLPGENDIPGYSLPGVKPVSTTDSKTAASSAAAVSMQLIPAISDAGGPQPRPYTYDWLQGEESDRRTQMTDLAKKELTAYLQAQAKATMTPAPAAQTARRKPAKPPEPVFENVKLSAYDPWTNNQPVLLFSAEAHFPAAAGAQAGSQGASDPDLRYSITLVAHPDIYNNLTKLYIGVTDKFHLDLTPRLELVDVVDADGDGRGEFLFRETSDVGTGWVIYRATADTLWKMFDSLNAE